MIENETPQQPTDSEVERLSWMSILVIFSIWAVLWGVITLVSNNEYSNDSFGLRIRTILKDGLFLFFWACCAVGLLSVIRQLHSRGASTKQKVLVHAILYVGSVFCFSACNATGSLLVHQYDQAHPSEVQTEDETIQRDYDFRFFFMRSLRSGIFISLLFYLFITAVITAIENTRALQRKTIRESNLEAQLAQANLNSLKSQLQPHFLFNVLNSIASLVRQVETQKAIEMISLLSDLLRHTLRYSDVQEISLKDEMEFVAKYLEIEQIRFGDRLSVNFQIDPETEAASIPVFLLQPIVENAVKHGISPENEGGRIEIHTFKSETNVCIHVRNTGAVFDADQFSSAHGIGLKNTRSRLGVLYGDRYRMTVVPADSSETIVSITIPFRLINSQSHS